MIFPLKQNFNKGKSTNKDRAKKDIVRVVESINKTNYNSESCRL